MLQELPEDHDLHHLRRSIPFVNHRRVAIDIGAHQGIWTRELMKHFRMVHAFEPQKDNYKKLEKITTERNINGHNLVTYPYALGSEQDFNTLVPGSENTGQYHITRDIREFGTLVHTFTLDEFNFFNVDFIKIDVEGMEWDVLMGALDTIRLYKPAILFEENGLSLKYYGIDPMACDKLLTAEGYQQVRRFNKDYLYTWKSSLSGQVGHTPSTM